MRSFKILSISLICLFITGLVCAQGLGASGEMKGTVTDPSGAIVANATVTVTDVARGIKRTVTTDATGEYRVPGLAPATYSVSVSKSGFQPEIAKAVVVTIGQTSSVDFHLKLSQVSEQIEVTAEAPVVETDKAHQSEVISQQYIQDLPINRRDYLTFTLLAPAVSDSTRMASDQDFRVKQTPQSGLSFYGSNGRGNSVTVDGGEANDDAGGVRLNLGQEAVQEFQINRSNYGADLGGASGATINIVSKSGTNDVHGSVFGYFRNDAMDAANPFSISQALAPGQAFNPAAADTSGTHIKDSLSRQQFGASVGFPITKDKTFLFSSFEGLRSDAQNAVPLLESTALFRPSDSVFNDQAGIIRALAAAGSTTVPCVGSTALPAAVCAGVLTNIFTVNPANPFAAYAVNQLENNGGLFPFNTRQYLTSVRFDHQFSDKNQMFMRYNFGHDNEENPDVQSLTGFSRGSSIHALDHTLLGAWFHQFSARTQNETRAQWNYSNFDVIPNFPGQVGIDLPGFGNFGSNIFIPSRTIMRRYEVADNFSMIRGKHTFKTGGEFLYRGNHTESDTFFPGRFVFGNLPGGLVSLCFQSPAACQLTTDPATGQPLTPASINSLQSLAVLPTLPPGAAVPQFYQQGFGDPVYNYPRPFVSAYFQDTWNVKSNLTLNYGVRYELDSQYGALTTDKNNFAPRVSFAWDPFGDKKTVIRAGYGIFYSPIYGQIADVVQTLGLVNGNRQIAQVFVPAVGLPLTSAQVFSTLFGQGIIQCQTAVAPNVSCITPTNLTQFGINITHTGPVPPLSVLFSAQPDYKNPYSQQAEFGIERQIGNSLSVSLSGIYVHTIGLPVAIDQNALPAPFSPVKLANGQIIQVRDWNTRIPNPLTGVVTPPCGVTPAAILNCFKNPALLQDNVYSSKGSALFEGGILEVKKRFSNYLSLFGSYTLSKAFDTTTDFNSDFGPQDSTNLSGERGLSDFDQRHKVVAAAVIDIGNRGDNAWGRVASNFQFSPIFRYNSGHPFNLLAGTDVNGDRHSTNDRPIGAGRNTGLGPAFTALDMRITRQFKVSEHSNLQVIAEGFNLFNHTNFAAVNNVVGPNFGVDKSIGGLGFTSFNVHGQLQPLINAPLAFTSAFPMRQLQLGARISF